MSDSTVVCARQHIADAKKVGAGGVCEDQAIGRSRGGLSIKIHAIVNAMSNLVGFTSPGPARPTTSSNPNTCSPACHLLRNAT